VKGHAASISPTVSEYLGIRYGQPATGQLRFAAPSFSANEYVRNLDFEREMMDADLCSLYHRRRFEFLFIVGRWNFGIIRLC
jgi:hypothetical protein